MPVVFCYLEGLTHAQAALQLRCGEATLRRRLAGARDRLRNRLVRRGFAPAASALVLWIPGSSGAVPHLGCRSTLRAAVRVAAGEAIAVAVGARLALLTRAGLDHDDRSVESDRLVALRSQRLPAALASAFSARRRGRVDQGRRRAARTSAAPPPAKAEPPPNKSSYQKHTIKGMVLGPGGMPLAGREVFWLGHPESSRSLVAMPRDSKTDRRIG